MTFGEKLYLMRKNAGFTQDEVASRLGISPQAVSKWENDLSCPDIMLLPEISKLYNITVDSLLCDDTELTFEQDKAASPEIPDIQEKKGGGKRAFVHTGREVNRLLKVNVLSQNGDDVNVKLPVSLVKSLKSVLSGIKLGNDSVIDLSAVDFDAIFELVDQGIIGDIVNVKTANGDTIRVYIEEQKGE